MPLDPITSAIVSSVISSAIESVLTPTPEEPGIGIVRMLPDGSRLGRMLPPGQLEVRIDGKTYPMSPGVQFRNELNMIVPPWMIQEPVRVRFMTDFSGAVHRVWILSSAETTLPENR
jgi:hypothetical protein